MERKEQHQDELAPAPLTPMVGRLAGLGRRLALDVGRLQATWQADAARTASTFAPAFGKHCYGAGPEEAGAGGETGGRDTLSSGSGRHDPSTGRLRWSGLEGLWSEGALPRSGLSGAVVGQRCYRMRCADTHANLCCHTCATYQWSSFAWNVQCTS